MRKKLVFWLKGLVLFGFCVVSIFLLGAGFNNTSYAYAEEGAIDSGPFSEADANAHPVNGWDSKKEHYYENGQQVCSKEIYDAKDKNWYWIDTNGSVDRNKDVYLQSNGGKWVRYDRVTGKMVKGLHYQDGAYYYFDQTTGAMAHGRVWVPEWNSYATFDSVSGRYVSKDSGNNNPGNTGGENIRGRFCKKSEKGQQRIDGDGTLIVCECRNGNNTPHWYAK